MSIELISILMFVSMLVLLMLGLPVAFVMGGIGVIFSFIFLGPQSFKLIALLSFSTVSNIVLVAAPLFILMGYLLERSGIGENLYKMLYNWSGGLRGGLAIATVVICALFAAMTGIAATATVTMGIVALPSMLNRNYDKSMVVGTIAAGGTLGVLIPPSIIMIILAMVTQQSVGKIFATGIGCGVLMAILFCAYIGIRAFIQPNLCPAADVKVSWKEKFISLRGVIAPLILIIAVLGAIFLGVASPTEAAAVGAVGALLCVIIYRRFTWQLLREALQRTVVMSAMVVWIIIGATVFVSVYISTGATAMITELMLGLEAGVMPTILIMLGVAFILGMVMEPAAIIMLLGPLYMAIGKGLQIDLIWFGALFIMCLQMGFITPPFGMSLFLMRSVCPPSIRTTDIYKSIIPFVAIMWLTIIFTLIFPQVALWLPNLMK